MSALNVVLYKKNGNSNSEMYPLTQDHRVGITSESANLPDNINTLEDLIDALGSLAFEDYVALNVSDDTHYGLVKIANADSEATDTVPTSKYLHDSLAGKVSTTGNETISGIKTFTDGIKVGSLESISYDSETDTINYGVPITPPEPEP